MNLTATERREVLSIVAKSFLDELRAEAGGSLAGLVVMPTATAAQLVGLSTKHLPNHLPIVEISPGKHGVTLRAVQEHIASKTKAPAA